MRKCACKKVRGGKKVFRKKNLHHSEERCAITHAHSGTIEAPARPVCTPVVGFHGARCTHAVSDTRVRTDGRTRSRAGYARSRCQAYFFYAIKYERSTTKMMILDRVHFRANPNPNPTRTSGRKRKPPDSFIESQTVASSKIQTQTLETQLQSFLQTNGFIMDVVVRLGAVKAGLRLAKTYLQPFLVASVTDYTENDGVLFCSVTFYFMSPALEGRISYETLSEAYHVKYNLSMEASETQQRVSDLKELSGQALKTLTRKLLPELVEWYNEKYTLQTGLEALPKEDVLGLLSPPDGQSLSPPAGQSLGAEGSLSGSVLQSLDAHLPDGETPGSSTGSRRRLFHNQESQEEDLNINEDDFFTMLEATSPHPE